jgi:hypothetical protein
VPLLGVGDDDIHFPATRVNRAIVQDLAVVEQPGPQPTVRWPQTELIAAPVAAKMRGDGL